MSPDTNTGMNVKTRRDFVAGASALAGCGFAGAAGALAATESKRLQERLTDIERGSGGRLGVAILDTASGSRARHRADERFPMCSTFKLLAAAALLKRVDEGRTRLDERIIFEPFSIVPYSPITEKRVSGHGMPLGEICEAAVTLSDNTAGNLLLASIGGPPGFTAFARTLGDAMTRLDRVEPDLNEATPGDPRDTTTPMAMLGNIQKLVLGDALSAPSKALLTKWMLGCKTCDTRLRAGLPAGWKTGDKTGTGERGSTNDVGVIWPPGRAPIIVTVYLTGTTASTDRRNSAIAAVGRAVADGGSDSRGKGTY